MTRSEVWRARPRPVLGGQTTLRDAPPCPTCGLRLCPISHGESVSFHCEGGHVFQARHLARAAEPGFRQGLEKVIAHWERRLRALWTTALEARRRGCLDVAAIVSRRTSNLASRIESLRSCLDGRGSRPRM
jgi:hypothetical protein